MNRPMASGAIVLGLAFIILSVGVEAADVGTEGFGVVQIAAVIVGVLLIGGGLRYLLRRQNVP